MRKKHPDPNTLVERAIVAAVPNVRSKGWRNAQMKVFAMRYGYCQSSWSDAQLEVECVCTNHSLRWPEACAPSVELVCASQNG